VSVAEVLVVVVATEVGRTGAAAAGMSVVLVVVLVVGDKADEAEVGQSLGPHARSVGQQPPPRVAAQDW
jgi:hypothetical protein